VYAIERGLKLLKRRIKGRYRDLCKKAHPDKGGAAEDFRKVREAFMHTQAHADTLLVDSLMPRGSVKTKVNIHGTDNGAAQGRETFTSNWWER